MTIIRAPWGHYYDAYDYELARAKTQLLIAEAKLRYGVEPFALMEPRICAILQSIPVAQRTEVATDFWEACRLARYLM